MKDMFDAYPLSFSQKSLWLISQSGVDNGAYNLYLSIKINSSIDIHNIEKIIHGAASKIVRTHSQLRSNYILKDDEPVQIIHANLNFRINVEDCAGLTGKELEAKIKDYSSKPFILESDILFRLSIFNMSGNEINLLLVCHHIVLDGVSAEIFFKEFLQYIHAAIHGSSSEIIPPVKDYHDFVEYESNLVKDQTGEQRLQYWKTELHDNTGHSGIPTDFIRPTVFSHQGKSKKFRVSDAISGFERHSAFTVLLGAYFLLLSRLSGSNDLTVVIPMMNREENDFKSIIGYFVNMAFIRICIEKSHSFNQLLDIVENKIKNARMNSYPFQLLFKRLGFRHQPNRFPFSDLFFETVKVKVFEPGDMVSLGDEKNLFDIEFQAIQQDSTPGDITVQFYEFNNSHYLEIRYRPDLFKEDTIDRFIDNYIGIVNSAIHNPSLAVSQIVENFDSACMVKRNAESPYSCLKFVDVDNESIESLTATATIRAADPVHQILLDIWKEVLNVNDVSVHDDFFSLGGQSLMAIKVISRINTIFNVNISIQSFFQNLTIYKLGVVVKNSIQGDSKISLHPIVNAGKKEYYPLSFSQERMWFLHELEPESIAYNFIIPLRFLGEFNIDILVESFKKLIRRHDQLHSNFMIIDGKPMQVVRDDYDVYFNIVDLSGLLDEDKENEACRMVEAEAVHLFDLKNEPLVRLTVIALNRQNNILLLNMHHIISDEWSLAVITYELNEIYKSSGRDTLPPLPLRYVDFSVWQRNVFAEEIFKPQMKYWKDQLCDLPVLQLPIDKRRPVVQTYNGSYYKEKIPDSLIRKIHETGSRNGATAYMVLLTCFYILLYRYSGQEDLAVGSPVANRTRVETEGMIGTFVNTLVMRGDLHGNPSFRELLIRIKETVISAFAHQDLPFERLVEELSPKRDMSILPLAQVLFNVMNVPFVNNFPENIQWQIYEVEVVGVQFDLVMTIEYDLLKEITLSYNRDLFEPETARQMLDHYLRILEIVLGDNEVRIKDLELLNDQELSRILVDWNSNYLNYPREVYPQIFEKQCRKTPDKVALIFKDTIVTYGELNRKANQAARYFSSHHLGHGSSIGIYLERSDMMLVCLLAVMKIGASYLPLDPAYPADRIAFMIEDSRADAVIADPGLLADIIKLQARVILLDYKSISGLNDSDVQNTADPGDLAYTIYTSGSTGKPKGVQIEHKSLMNFLYSMKKTPGLTENDRLCAVTPISFDISILELFLPLIAGATVIITPGDYTADGKLLLNYIKDNNATIMQATPSTWRLLLDAGWKANVLQKILCGGEPIPPDLVEKILDLGLTIWNLYGPTETTVWSTLYHIKNIYDPIMIGKPIGNTKIYILDTDMKPVPVGVPGELFIGGDGVARGYLNRPDLTSDRFIANPFSSDNEERLYRTGDIVRYRHDGNIEFIGRNDQQVKIRGHRIELGEINSVTTQYGGIKYAETVVREDRPGDKRIITYIIKDDKTASISLIELKSFVKKNVPAYMVPSFFIELQTFPLLPNGKINTKALPAPDQIDSNHEIIKPANSEQEKLLEIWKDVMNVKQISIRENFFDLGGYSLLAVRLIAKINEAFGIDLPLRTLFLHPDIESLSRVIVSIEGNTGIAQKDAQKGGKPGVHDQYHPLDEKNGRPGSILLSGASSIFPIQPRGNRPFLFIVSGVHAEPDGFYRYLSCIIPSLGLDQPVYGLRPRGLLGSEQPHDSIEDMAADYIKEIRLIQPKGPYFIGGECIGGLAAYEIVRQLEKSDDDIGVLLLLDTVHVSKLKNFYYYTSKMFFDLKQYARRVIVFIISNKLNLVKAFKIFLKRKISLSSEKNTRDRELRHIRHVEAHYLKVLRKYRPERIKSRIVLIANEEDNAIEKDLGWRILYNEESFKDSHGCTTGNFKSIIVKGNHITRLTVYGMYTGALIRKEIDNAASGSHDPDLNK